MPRGPAVHKAGSRFRLLPRAGVRMFSAPAGDRNVSRFVMVVIIAASLLGCRELDPSQAEFFRRKASIHERHLESLTLRSLVFEQEMPMAKSQ